MYVFVKSIGATIDNLIFTLVYENSEHISQICRRDIITSKYINLNMKNTNN